MLANARGARRQMMRTNDLHPPRAGLNSDPILYGVAAGLATLFPPVLITTTSGETDATDGLDRSKETSDAS